LRRTVHLAEKQINDLWGATMLSTVLIIILILALIGAFPRWGYSAGWGYGSSGLLGVILIVVLILALTGHV
jgi:sterol desaturase/sphingolipid hydroxylase (fatty acid hydroxylase superfamily)